MFLPSSASLISRYPGERETIERLAGLLQGRGHIEVTLDNLVAQLRPRSVEVLAMILADLTRIGFFHRVVRVESSASGGIDDFARLEDVPPRIHDWRTDEDIVVTPDRLRVVYKANAGA
jgi:hypothetical protein